VNTGSKKVTWKLSRTGAECLDSSNQGYPFKKTFFRKKKIVMKFSLY